MKEKKFLELRGEMGRHGMSQKDLAIWLGLSDVQVCRLFKNGGWSREVKRRLSKKFNRPQGELFQ